MNKPNTRAEIAAPRRKNFLPELPEAPAPANNMRSEHLAPMTFNMPRGWHTRFKMTATMHGISMKDLLLQAFAVWEREQEKNK
jgi:hypothetical protein